MKTVDLIAHPEPKLWQRCLDVIYNSTDALRDNYLSINFNDYLSFPAVINNNKIICFSGLQISERKWGQNIARASSRMWIHPAYRHTGITKFVGGKKFLNTTHCLPVQFDVALNSNIDVLFISRENNLFAFKQYLNLVYVNTGYKFNLENSSYNVCGPQQQVPPSCCQYVALHYLNEQGVKTWQDNMFKFKLMNF